MLGSLFSPSSTASSILSSRSAANRDSNFCIDGTVTSSQDMVVTVLMGLLYSYDINSVYLTMQSAIQSLFSSGHCRIKTRSGPLTGLPVKFQAEDDHVIVTVEIDQRQSRRSTWLVCVETETMPTRADESARRSLETLARAAVQQCARIREYQELKFEAHVAKGLLALRRHWGHHRPRNPASFRVIQSFVTTTQDFVHAERIVVIVADYLDNRLVVVPTDQEDCFMQSGGGDGGDDDHVDGSTYPIDKGILGAVIQSRKPVLVNNVQEHRSYRPSTDPFTDSTMSQIICQPVCDRSQQVVGIIVAINHVTNDQMEMSDSIVNIDIHHGFTDHDVDLLEQCCLELNDFLLMHFSEVCTRRATHSNISAFSLVDSYLGRSNTEQSATTRDNSKSHERCKSTSSIRAVSQPMLLMNNSQVDHDGGQHTGSSGTATPAETNAQTIETMSLVKRLSLTSAYEAQIDTLNFNVFEPSAEQLQCLCLVMMNNVNVFSKFDRDLVTALISEIRQQYLDQPFHNWRHAFSVMHMTYLFIIRHEDVRLTLGVDKTLAVMVAALGHDIKHPGNTNQFEINSDSELAQKFNGKSVLENYHAASLMKILRNASTDPFQNLEAGARRSLRECMIDAILGTDMSKHMTFNTRLGAMDDRNAILAPESYTEQNFLLETIVHASDLSAQGYGTSIAVEWESRLTLEFRQQAALEASLGIPVANFMTDLDNDKHRAQLQISFIDFVLRPFWKEVARLFLGTADVYHNIILRSRKYYSIVANEGQEAALEYLESQASTASTQASHSLRAHTFPNMIRIPANTSGNTSNEMAMISEYGPGPEPNRRSSGSRVLNPVSSKSILAYSHSRLLRESTPMDDSINNK